MMNNMIDLHRVFALTDERDRILDINSDAFLADSTGWVQIDEGVGDKYHHAQGNYLPGPKYDERGIPRYKLVDSEVVERTPEEIEADYVPPEAGASLEDRVGAVEIKTGDLEEALDMILSGVTE